VLRITSSQDRDETRIEVSDQGPGIAWSERERIFEPFHRLSDRLSDGVTGTGIGLSISRDLARLHGGDLCLKAGGEGATFVLTLHTSPSEEASKE
jgi:signal transduction histidine kinase